MHKLPALVWHYTPAENLSPIVQSGVLLPASIGVTPPEKPILWFSADQYWEPTACKAVRASDGGLRRLSMQETFEIGAGLVRFGCPLNLLFTGDALRRAARMKTAIWRGLATEGKKQGADPNNWWGRIKPLPIIKLIVQVMNSQMQWEQVTPRC